MSDTGVQDGISFDEFDELRKPGPAVTGFDDVVVCENLLTP